MRQYALTIAAALTLSLAGCSWQPNKSDAERRRDEPKQSVAHKAGEAAYDITQKTKKVAKKAAKELKEAGQEAREGWKEQKREDRSRAK